MKLQAVEPTSQLRLRVSEIRLKNLSLFIKPTQPCCR